jgi:hypothetical protein
VNGHVFGADKERVLKFFVGHVFCYFDDTVTDVNALVEDDRKHFCGSANSVGAFLRIKYNL